MLIAKILWMAHIVESPVYSRFRYSNRAINHSNRTITVLFVYELHYLTKKQGYLHPCTSKYKKVPGGMLPDLHE